jgi:hypothetical protein
MTDRYVEDIRRGDKRYRIIWEEMPFKRPPEASIAIFLMPEGTMIWDTSSADEGQERMVRHAKMVIESLPE